jgi:hypothetical protein
MLGLGRLELVPSLLGSRFTLLRIPYPKDHPRLVFRVQPGEPETNPRVDTGDKRRFVGEVNIY